MIELEIFDLKQKNKKNFSRNVLAYRPPASYIYTPNTSEQFL